MAIVYPAIEINDFLKAERKNIYTSTWAFFFSGLFMGWDYLGVEGLYDKIQIVSSSFSRKQMMETLEKLVTREILSETNMLYRFPVNLLRKWLSARYPLRKVREEI